MHGGSIQAYSEGPGRGSEFILRLPAVIEVSASIELPPMRNTFVARRRRVLIVDDNPDGAESLAMLLELHGHETHKAHDGRDAIEAAERLRPDAVLLDIGLPNLDGYEVCRRLRGEPWGRNLLLIALTGWGQQEDRERSREAGFNNHLVKPVDHDALLALLTDRATGPVASPV
jgi:CheY-like chemotaxis protein